MAVVAAFAAFAAFRRALASFFRARRLFFDSGVAVTSFDGALAPRRAWAAGRAAGGGGGVCSTSSARSPNWWVSDAGGDRRRAVPTAPLASPVGGAVNAGFARLLIAFGGAPAATSVAVAVAAAAGGAPTISAVTSVGDTGVGDGVTSAGCARRRAAG